MAKKKQSIYYIDNKLFHQEMTKYIESVKYAKENGLEEPRIPEYIGKCFWLLSERIAMNSNFRNYPFIDDMKSDAIETCVMYLKNYDPTRTQNPFAYFTTYCYNAFILRIKKEKKHHYIKFKSLEQAMINNDLSSFQNDDGKNIAQPMNNDYMNNIISTFENDVKERKAKSKAIKEQKEKEMEDVITDEV